MLQCSARHCRITLALQAVNAIWEAISSTAASNLDAVDWLTVLTFKPRHPTHKQNVQQEQDMFVVRSPMHVGMNTPGKLSVRHSRGRSKNLMVRTFTAASFCKLRRTVNL